MCPEIMGFQQVIFSMLLSILSVASVFVVHGRTPRVLSLEPLVYHLTAAVSRSLPIFLGEVFQQLSIHIGWYTELFELLNIKKK